QINGIAGIGIGIGLMTIIGQTIGAGRKEEAKYYMVKLTGVAFILVFVSCILVFALTKPVTYLAGMESISAAMCFEMMLAITIVKPISWTISFIPAYGMRAAGDVRFSMITGSITMWIFRVATCIFLIRVCGMGPMAVWIGMFTDWTVRTFAFGYRYLSGKWLRHRVI
ncbi:MAG: MATE family efflux transporter, partial [Clostridiales bacterium]|nr:MATE family efflux transporter [Clostridiales bacterium]